MASDADAGAGTQATLTEGDSDAATFNSHWERAVDHAHINHEGMVWQVVHSNSDIPEDVAYERMVNWTSNFLAVVDHAYEWGGFDV